MFNKIISTLGTKIFSGIINFLIILITAHQLGAEGRGLISLLITTITFVLLFNNFMGGTTLIYLASRHNITNILISTYSWAFLVCTSAFFIFNILEIKGSLDIYFLSLLFSLTAINLNILTGQEKINLNNIISLLQVVLNFVLLSIFFIILNKKNLSYFILSLYTCYGLSFIISLILLRRDIKFKFSNLLIRDMKAVLKYGFISQLANIFQFLNYRLNYFLLEHYGDTKDVGIYSTGVSLAEAVWLIGGSLALVQYSRISNSQNKNESKVLSLNLAKLSLFLSATAVIILLILPSSVYTFLFGKEFYQLKSIILILSPGILSLGLSLIFSHYFAGVGNYHINAITSFIGLIITLVIGSTLIPNLGISGAGITSSIAYISTSTLLLIIYLRKTQTNLSELLPTKFDIKTLFAEFKVNITGIKR